MININKPIQKKNPKQNKTKKIHEFLAMMQRQFSGKRVVILKTQLCLKKYFYAKTSPFHTSYHTQKICLKMDHKTKHKNLKLESFGRNHRREFLQS